MALLSLNDSALNLKEKYLCLDFSNTLDWRNGPNKQETIQHYQDFILWALEKGLISTANAAVLKHEAERRPEEAEAEYRRVIDLRETIYRVFSAKAHHQPVVAADLSTLNRYISEAMGRAVLAPGKDSFQWAWSDEPGALDRLAWPIARSAAELLTSADFNRVGECANDQGCAFLFIDTSRNHSRRWCSMEICGNRAKAQRHYHKDKPGLVLDMDAARGQPQP